MSPPVIELVGPAVGGIRNHVIELTARLRAAGRDVVVAGPAGVLGDAVAVDHVVDIGHWRSPRGWARARRQLQAGVATSGAEVVHAHGLKAGWVAVACRPRPKVVLTAHNVVLPGMAGPANPVLAALERALVHRVDQLISPSPAIDDRFADLLPADRRHVILPVSPPAVEPRPRAAVRAELGVGDDQPLVVVAARLHPQKDLATFIGAMARLHAVHPDVVARIVGDGPSRDEVERLITANGLERVVGLAGASARAVDQMAAADVVALSSVWEAVPLAVVEAMSLGVPVVTTRVGITDQLISTGESGWVVDIGDAAALGDALIEAFSARPQLPAVGSAGRARVAALADPDTLVAAVDEVYRAAGHRVAS